MYLYVEYILSHQYDRDFSSFENFPCILFLSIWQKLLFFRKIVEKWIESKLHWMTTLEKIITLESYNCKENSIKIFSPSRFNFVFLNLVRMFVFFQFFCLSRVLLDSLFCRHLLPRSTASFLSTIYGMNSNLKLHLIMRMHELWETTTKISYRKCI